MTAHAVVASLLEADPDEVDPKASASHYMETVDFDEGIEDIVRAARALFQRLVKAGVIEEIRAIGGGIEVVGFAIGASTGFDSSAVAQEVLRLAIERRGALGAQKAYRNIRRHGHSIL